MDGVPTDGGGSPWSENLAARQRLAASPSKDTARAGQQVSSLPSQAQLRVESFMPKVTLTYESVVECDLDLKAVEKYLESKKWRDTGSYGRFGRSFESDEYGKTITLPTTDRIADFNIRIAELVRTLAWCEKRPVPEILADMQ
jgi:hypothetical protein